MVIVSKTGQVQRLLRLFAVKAYTIMIIESFRFEEEISFEVFARILEKYSTRKALLYHFSPEKLMRLCLA